MWVTCGTKFNEFTEENGPLIEEFLYNLGTEFTNWETTASAAINDVFSSYKSWWEEDGSRIYGEIHDVLGDLGAIIMQLWNEWIDPVIKNIQSDCSKLWNDHLKPLWDNVLAFLTSIWDAIKALWDAILKPVIKWCIDIFAPRFKALFARISKSARESIGFIIDIVNGFITTLRGLLDFITGVFTGDWKKAWGGIKTYFGGIWDTMCTLAERPINAMLSGIESFVNGFVAAINTLIRAVNKLSFTVPDWVPGIGGEKFGLNISELKNVSIPRVSIPRLATGGYISANTPQLAVIGDNKREGEIVAPESKIAEAVAVGVSKAMQQLILLLANKQSSTSSTPIIIKIGEDDFWSGFIDYHNGIVKRTGDSPLLV